ncbi:MAG: ABC transporter ATP-binding protein [bacterium]
MRGGLKLQNVSKRFGELTVLNDISLELADGELLVLLGPSGCGKSTLLRLIAGLEELDGGRIEIDGRRVDLLPPKERDVAMVFQNYSLYPHMTVRKNLAFPLRVAKLPRSDINERVNQTAALLDLTRQLDQRPAQLSGGQRQRVALGRAIIRKPALFLLDEPLSNLDSDLRRRMRREIVSLQRRLQVNTIHVTHDQTEALTMADRIAVMNEGRLQQLGTPRELYNRPANTFVARFIGQPPINMVDLASESPLTILLRTFLPDNFQSKWAQITAGLRPQDLSLAEDGPLECQVVACEYHGHDYVVRAAVGQVELTLSGLDHPQEIGQSTGLTLNKGDIHLFDSVSGLRLP